MWNLVIFLSVAVLNVECARILAVFPLPSFSHQIVFRPFVHELAKRGHEVTLITPDPAFPKGGGIPNLKEIDVHDVAYSTWKTSFVDKVPELSKFELLLAALDVLVYVADSELRSPQVQDEIFKKDRNYDLLILEACVPTLLGLAHKFKAPVIQISSFFGTSDNYESMGAPTHLFLYPDMLASKLNDLTLLDKLKSVSLMVVLKSVYRLYYINKVKKAVIEHFGEDTPDFYELEKRIDLLFINIYPIWESNRPVPPGVIFLGGLHLQPVKELPNDFKTYLDSSKNGVIYVSFGTNVNPSTLPLEKVKAMINVFEKLPFDVLWKWDDNSLPYKPKNVKVFKWMPQNDILHHPKVKLFITQGGIQSTDEAISAGVPLIGIPMLIDQHSNVEKYVKHKIGIKLNFDTLTEVNFYESIMTIMSDDSYRKNVVNLRTVMRDTPQTPLEKAVWWTEHILRHGGGKHLKGPAANISFFQYIEIELLLTLASIFFIIIGFNILILHGFIKLIRRCIAGKPKIKKH